ncbi:hypothetical protein FRC00_003124 [Tulasnella sp. 408]|nr:hypothetical protein FRC00_003124 [Tulasnella sp. 408]
MIYRTTILPPETWLLVIESLFHSLLPSLPAISISSGEERIARCPPEILDLCLVSRFFLQMADPFRFREINMVTSISGPTPGKMSHIQEFLEFVEVRQEVKSWVKAFEVGPYPNNVWRHQPAFTEYIAALPRIQSLIPQLKALHTLRCNLTVLTPSLYSGILRLEALKTLDLKLDQLDSEAVNMDLLLGGNADSPICPVRRLEMSGEMANTDTTASAILALVQLETLKELKYWARMWWDPPSGITLFQAIRERIPNHSFSGLRYLEVVTPKSGVEAQHFLHLGEQCPNLTELRIHRSFAEDPRDLALWLGNRFTERHFPSLQRFAGPLAIAPIFTLNRPVYSVETNSYPFRIGSDTLTTPVHQIVAIKPSVPVRILNLFARQWDDDGIEAVSQYHPHVEQFTYSCPSRWSLRTPGVPNFRNSPSQSKPRERKADILLTFLQPKVSQVLDHSLI